MAEKCSQNALPLCDTCKQMDSALNRYYQHHRDETGEDWQKVKIDAGTLDELRLSLACPCCQDLAACFPAFETPYSPVGKFRLVIDNTDIMLKYKIPRNMRGELETDHLFLLPVEPVASTLEHATPYDPTYFDPQLAWRWITRCQTLHGEKCCPKNKVPLHGLPSILLIDVEDWCIVSAPPEARYVALSYCWGQTAAVCSLKHNIAALKTPGSLSPATTSYKLPPTVADAIIFTREVGERYLWVDALCIVQDDNDEKQRNLDSMAFIYANSFFTLVAADGPNADHGLRGVVKGVRDRDLPHHQIRGLPSGTLMLNKPRAGLRLDSVWNSRGWTMQESLFSRRLVVFDGFVSWVCCEAEWSEDTDRELDFLGSSSFHLTDRVGLYSRLPLWPDLRLWGSLVSQFNKRNLTFEKDVIDAFAGVEAAASPSFPGGFLLGLPQLFFDIALLWQPERKLTRRGDHDHHFPSWSWVGWKGEIETQLWDVCSDLPYSKRYPLPEIIIDPLVQWKAVHEPGATDCHVVPNSYVLHRSKPAISRHSGWSRHLKHHDRHPARHHHYYFSHDQVPNQLFRYPVPLDMNNNTGNSPNTPSPSQPGKGLCFLSFTAMRSWFKVGGILEDRFQHQEDYGSQPVAFNVSILDAANRAVGALRLNLEDTDEAPVGLPCELIALSAGRARVSKGPHGYLWRRDEWALGEWYHNSVLLSCSSQEELQVTILPGEAGEEGEESEWEDVDEDDEDDGDGGGNLYEFYHVLWIERSGDVCYRKALGRIIMQAWRSWEQVDIMLG